MENNLDLINVTDEEVKKILMKGKDIVQTNYSLKPVENKFFQLVLYNNQKQKHNGICECEIPISDFESLIGNKNERNLKEVEKRLRAIAKKSLTFYNSKIKGEYQLISGHEVIKERNSINVIMLERVVEIMKQYQENKAKVSPYAPINLSLFFELRSFYSQKLYDEFRLWSRHNKEIIHIFTLEELRFVTGTENKYPRWSNFSQKVLDVACDEINEKAKMNVKYKALKTKGAVTKVEFTIIDYEPHIYFNNNIIMKKLNSLKEKDLSSLSEEIRKQVNERVSLLESNILNNTEKDTQEAIEREIKEIEALIINNSSSNKQLINLNSATLKIFNKDFGDYDFEKNNYYMALLEAEAIALEKTGGDQIKITTNYNYFKTVLSNKIDEIKNAEKPLIDEIEDDTDEGYCEAAITDEECNEDIEKIKVILEDVLMAQISEISYKMWLKQGVDNLKVENNIVIFETSDERGYNIISKRYYEYIAKTINEFFGEDLKVELRIK